MSRAPWATTAADKPYGFRVTIERSVCGAREIVVLRAKTTMRTQALKTASYKQGFIRVVEATALTKAEWEAAKL